MIETADMLTSLSSEAPDSGAMALVRDSSFLATLWQPMSPAALLDLRRDYDCLARELLLADLESGFDLLVQHYSAYMRMIARNLVGLDDADDVMQEAFLRAFQALQKYPRDRVATLKIRPWLRQIVRNVALNHCASIGRHEVFSLERAEEIGTQLLSEKFASPEADWIRREILHEVKCLVKSLAVRDHSIVTLHFFRGWPYVLIARQLGCSEALVRKRAARMLARLRRELVDRFGGVQLSDLLHE